MCYSIGRKRGDCMCGNECCNVDAPDLRHDAPLLLLDEYGWLSGSPCMGCYVEEEGSVDKTERVAQDFNSLLRKTRSRYKAEIVLQDVESLLYES